MDNINIFCCPKCKSRLRRKSFDYYCEYCQFTFPEVAGILDFRITKRPDDGEKKTVEILIRNYKQMNCAQLTRLRSPNDASIMAPRLLELRERSILRNFNFKQEGIVKFNQIEYSIKSLAKSINRNLCLEIGCGQGGSLLSLSSKYKLSIGLDINLAELIIAKKKIEEEKGRDIILVCGESEYLPFGSSVFDLVNMSNAIEHVASARKTLIESHRVTNENGIVFFNSPNRFCLTRTEPHVHIWGVGFMPRKWMEKYVRITSGNTIHYYRSSAYHLLSLFELRRTLAAAFKKNYKVINYIVDESSPPRTFIGKTYREYKTVNKLFNSFPLSVFCPAEYFVIAWKQ